MRSLGSLFKPDRVRRIDRSIDYFGETPRMAADACPALGASKFAGRRPRRLVNPAHPLDPSQERYRAIPRGAGGTETSPVESPHRGSPERRVTV